MLGRIVAVLIDDDLAAGPHIKTFDASALASGVYIFVLQTKSSLHVQKALLLR
jgi:hypothetical protein